MNKTSTIVLIGVSGCLGVLIGFGVAVGMGNSTIKKKENVARNLIRLSVAVTDLDTLKKLRSNNNREAIRALENRCFAYTVPLIDEGIDDAQRIVSDHIKLVVEYRSIYATNQSEWNPTERVLESLLNRKGEK